MEGSQTLIAMELSLLGNDPTVSHFLMMRLYDRQTEKWNHWLSA